MSAPAGQSDAPVLTAHRAGLSGCHRCGRVWPQDQARCHRCGAHLVAPDRRGLQKVWAWWLAGLIAYIPANVFPMMSTQTFAGLAGNSEATILGGVVELMHYGNYDIALIVFVASVIVPVGKFLAKRGEGVHHVGYAVPDVAAALTELRAQGFEVIDPAPRIGSGGTTIAFLHPRSMGGVLVELVEEGTGHRDRRQ